MKDRFQRFNSGRAIFFLLATITLILFFAVLKVTSSVVLPFTISLLLAIVTTPLVKFLGKFHIPRLTAVLLVLILILSGLVFIGMAIYSSGPAILSLYPKYEDRIREIYIWVALIFELPYDQDLSIFDNIWGQLGIRNYVRIWTLSFSNSFIIFLGNAFMVAIFTVFILMEGSYFKRKLDKAFESERTIKIKKITTDVMTQVTRYLSIKFFISLVTGFLVGLGLWIVGLEFAIIWGVIQFVLNFIPTIGSIAIGVIVVLFSIIQFWPDPMPILAVGLIMLSLNMIIGTVIEPKIMGDNLGLSPLVILVSLMAFGWLWGFTGLVLAVPMLAIIRIVCENITVLEPISILLGSSKAVMSAKSVGDREKSAVDSGDSPDKDTPA